MRLNTPLVDREFQFPPGQTLVSMTDLKGRITYCNAAFVEVSGFAMDELLGQPHNLIRHPDMPEEAFRDLWATIASGSPWSAPVKNRRKDGSYYWVMANVTPVLKGEQPVGYMSVRTHLPHEQKQQAQAAYAELRAAQGQQRMSQVLRGGRLLRMDWAGRCQRALRPGLGGHLALTGLTLGAAGFGAGLLAAGAGWPAGLLAAGGATGLALWRLRVLALRPLQGLKRFCNRMAAGDLGQRLPVPVGVMGELAGALNQLNVNLLSVVGDARNEAAQLRRATADIATGNTELSGRTGSQAASLQQTAAAIEQITRAVQQNTESATQAATLAQDASGVTRAGSEAVGALFDNMQQIQDASQRIGDIISVIEGIAFQTNILSLNAAVEAARAGEQGKGFAVVAAEVRALAQRTAGAAKEVKALIQASGRTVEGGTRQAELARSTIAQALGSVDSVAGLMQQISHGAQEQLTGISQVNQAVGQLDGITQQNATLVEQMAASAHGLERRAASLAASVEVFQLGGT